MTATVRPRLDEDCAKPARDAAAPASLSFAWTGNAASCSYRLEGWRKINADDIEYRGPSGWTTTEPTAWTGASANGGISFADLARGHYTFHLRSHDGSGRLSALQTDWTVLVR